MVQLTSLTSVPWEISVVSACEMGDPPPSALPPPGAHSHYTLFPSPQPTSS